MNIAKQLRLNAKYFVSSGSFDFQQNRLGYNKAIYRIRNACIDKVLRDYEYNQPSSLFHSRVIEDKATSQDRANHYGVNVGDTIRKYRKKRNNYDSVKAGKLKEIRAKAISINLIDVVILEALGAMPEID